MGGINPSRKSYRQDTSSAKTRGLISEQFRSDSQGRDLTVGIMSQAMFGAPWLWPAHSTGVLFGALDVRN